MYHAKRVMSVLAKKDPGKRSWICETKRPIKDISRNGDVCMRQTSTTLDLPKRAMYVSTKRDIASAKRVIYVTGKEGYE